MKTKHDDIAVLAVIEGGKRDCLRRQPGKFSAEDVGGYPLAGQAVLGNRPGLDDVVAAAQAKTIVG